MLLVSGQLPPVVEIPQAASALVLASNESLNIPHGSRGACLLDLVGHQMMFQALNCARADASLPQHQHPLLDLWILILTDVLVLSWFFLR